MNLWFRVLWVIIASFFRPRLKFQDESVLTFHVMPHDLDINIHMNNARYMALMDLGRCDMILRGGLVRTVLKNRWQPVIASALVRFRRPLAPFQTFQLRTRILSWDEKWLYIQHIIESKGVVACHAVVRGAFVRSGSVVSPAEIALAAGHTDIAPALPLWVAHWRDAEAGADDLPNLTLVPEKKTCVR